MKLQEKKEYREKGIDELAKRLHEVQTHLGALRIDFATKKLKNHQEINKTRKEIAFINTILIEKITQSVHDNKA